MNSKWLKADTRKNIVGLERPKTYVFPENVPVCIIIVRKRILMGFFIVDGLNDEIRLYCKCVYLGKL